MTHKETLKAARLIVKQAYKEAGIQSISMAIGCVKRKIPLKAVYDALVSMESLDLQPVERCGNCAHLTRYYDGSGICLPEPGSGKRIQPQCVGCYRFTRRVGK